MTLEVDVRVHAGGFAVEATFTAGPGTVALLGPNGAGKSTLVGAIAGLRPPDLGRITLDGRVLSDVDGGVHVPPEDRRIGVVFQDRLLFPHLSALDNVAFPLRADGTSRPDARARAGRQLAAIAPDVRPDARPADLSGGEQQRVALARALANNPPIVLADEPTGNLDTTNGRHIMELLRDVHRTRGTTLVLVTHDAELAALADAKLVLRDGRVV